MEKRFAPKRLMGVLAALVILAFLAILLLIAFGEDLAPRDRPGATPYSRSATGYQGIVRLLEASGRDVSISRREEIVTQGRSSLLVMTPEPYGRSTPLEEVRGPVLVILPKWIGRNDGFVRWQETDTQLTSEVIPEALLDAMDIRADIVRTTNETLNWQNDARRVDTGEHLQLIDSASLESVVSATSGTLLAKLPGEPVWVLSDPDILANHGIDDPTNARLALDLIGEIARGRPIIFDATLNGFQIDQNPIKSMVSPPMLGVSLLGVAGLFLLFWAAFSTFGPRRRETRDLALGTRTLIDSTAGLFSMTRREGRLANDYLRQTRARLRRRLGLPRGLSDADISAILDRIAEEKGLERRFSDFEQSLAKPMPRRKLLAEARALHHWTDAIIPSG